MKLFKNFLDLRQGKSRGVYQKLIKAEKLL